MRKKEVAISIVIAILLALNIRMGYKLQEMQNSIEKVKSSVNHLDGRFSSIDRDIKMTLYDIRREHVWIIDKDYDIVNIDDKFDQAKVTFNWTFRDLGKNEKVYVLYGEENNGEIEKWSKIEAIHIGGLNYKAKAKLSYDKNYEFQVVAENKNSKKTGKLEDIDLYNKLMNRIDFEVYFPTMSNSQVEVFARIQNFYRGLEKLKIKSAKANIYYKEKLIKSVDITDVAEKECLHGEIDKWEYSNIFELDELFKDVGFEEMVDNVKIQIVVKDYLGREYKSKLEDF
ncbi:hypothetical protein [Crassaminicella indica]|uniref:Uncharacterized protein n=1 Tax=Crassaminicella indica TaxID=2855394 RepID=A0ABX8RDS1_9CLOT|nr:hypothetical protein [Crassaminicella indica]QXM06911.1 hypothetical protein KVH43_04110 [Crassaminicella indica]